MTKLEQLADLRKKRIQAHHNELRQFRKSFDYYAKIRVEWTFWEQVQIDYDEQIKTLKRKIGPGDY